MSGSWGFTTSRPTDARYGDDVAKYAMSDGDQGLKTFVREVLQNSNDAGLGDEPAEVTFKIETLEGEGLQEYLEALNWHAWSEHAELSKETESGEYLNDALSRIVDNEELRILTIKDCNTQGLTGAETADESNFTALVRDVLFSSKSGDTAGGSYGLGKAVLWLFSGLSMVLFNSTLSEDDPRADSPRLIGRTRLPTHKSADGETIYQGHGWFGKMDDTGDDRAGARPESIWGEEAESVASALHLDRPDESPGTSIQVVDFRDPTAEERMDEGDLADQITEQAIEWFWPAIYRNNLRISVETENDTYNVSVDNQSDYAPFAACLAGRSETADELSEPGDVIQSPIELDVPNKSNGESTESGELALVARRAQSGETTKENSVAFVRGAGMVVEYYDRDKVVIGNQGFHAVLLGGHARTWGLDDETLTTADDDIEEFLTTAEPPQHDEWKRTETLANSYSQGFRKSVEGIKKDVTDNLRSLVAPDVDRGATGPERLGNRFPIGRHSHSGRSQRESPSSQRVTGSTEMSFDETYNHWVFSGEVEPLIDSDQIQEITVTLIRMGEEGVTGDRLGVETISSTTMGTAVSTPEENNVEVGWLDVPEDASTVQFEGVSKKDPRRVKTRLNVSVDVVSGGDE